MHVNYPRCVRDRKPVDVIDFLVLSNCLKISAAALARPIDRNDLLLPAQTLSHGTWSSELSWAELMDSNENYFWKPSIAIDRKRQHKWFVGNVMSWDGSNQRWQIPNSCVESNSGNMKRQSKYFFFSEKKTLICCFIFCLVFTRTNQTWRKRKRKIRCEILVFYEAFYF